LLFSDGRSDEITDLVGKASGLTRRAAERRLTYPPRAAATDGNLQYLTETAMPESKSTGASPVDRPDSAAP